MKDRNHPLRPDAWHSRILDKKIEQLLNISTVIDLHGIRGCGKTWCGLSHAKSIISADDETVAMPLIQMDARIALTGPRPHAVDEWSSFPELRNQALRASNEPGSFMLLSSSEPPRVREDQRSTRLRVARIHMRTLTLAERGISTAAVSLEDLVTCNGAASALPQRDGFGVTGAHDDGQELYELALPICEGGWSAAVSRSHADALGISANQASSLLVGDARRQGRKESVARAILGSIELATGGDTSYAVLAAHAASAGLAFPSRNTLTAYARTFHQLYLVEELPGWKAPIRSSSRVKTKPRLVLADPSLGITATGLGVPDLRDNPKWLEAGFKALALHDLLAYAEALPARLRASASYYADADGTSADIVLTFGNDWAAIIIATKEGDVPAAIKQLGRLTRKVVSGESGMGDPVFRLVVTPGGTAWRDGRTGTVVAPISALGA